MSRVKGFGAPCQAISLIMECGRLTTFINIQMRQNEAAQEKCVAQLLSGACARKKQGQDRCVGMLFGRGQHLILSCSRDAAVLIFLLLIWAPLFKQVKTSVLLAPISKGCRLIEAKVYLRDGNMLPFLCFAVASHCHNQHGRGWPNFVFQRLSPWVMGE